MQPSMLKNQLSKAEIEMFLEIAPVGVLGTINADGSPYLVPLNFIYEDQKIYYHCREQGLKSDNILRQPQVCFHVYEMHGIKNTGAAIETSTFYTSATLNGTAEIVTDFHEKDRILRLIVRKYAADLADQALSEGAVKNTCVVAIAIREMTGKKRV